jgi:hypothetical protein
MAENAAKRADTTGMLLAADSIGARGEPQGRFEARELEDGESFTCYGLSV